MDTILLLLWLWLWLLLLLSIIYGVVLENGCSAGNIIEVGPVVVEILCKLLKMLAVCRREGVLESTFGGKVTESAELSGFT